MQTVIESERLYLREFNSKDAIHLYTMNLDEAVIKYTGDVAFKSEAEATLFLSKYDQYKRYKMGRWAVCDKKTHEFLGWCGLKYHPKGDFVEVGYRFYKKHWKKGYATESAKASILYGFNSLKLDAIYAHAHIDNIASHRVIEKCGLDFINKNRYNGMPANLYKIKNKNIIIKPILAEETYSVRHPVLREGRPIEDCVFDNDELESTLHLGLYFKNKLIGVATFLQQTNKRFEEPIQFQLRGMAILGKEQGHGFGQLLLQKGEALLTNKKANRIWFNAREKASGFYQKNNYEIIGDAFDVPKIGLHYVMTKKL